MIEKHAPVVRLVRDGPDSVFTLFTLLAYLNYTPETPSQNWTRF